MTDKNTQRLHDRIRFLETINENQAETIQRLQREKAAAERENKILKGQRA